MSNYPEYRSNPYEQDSANQRYGGSQQYGNNARNDRYAQPEFQPYAPQTLTPTHTNPAAAPPPSILSNPDFLAHVESIRKEIDTLSANISQIASLHQRAISSLNGSPSAALESLVSQTQVLNTRIRDQIKRLELDAARSGGNPTKNSQMRNLKNQFRERLEQYRAEEVAYKKRYQDQIARQYRIINPSADEAEVREAVEADWGDEGVFQTALRSNRTGTATTVLGAVRARHNDIQNIERTLIELNQLFMDMAETVAVHEADIMANQKQTEEVVKDTRVANNELKKSVSSARRARKLKWICLIILLLVLITVAVVLIIKLIVIPNQERKKNREASKPASTTSAATT